MIPVDRHRRHWSTRPCASWTLAQRNHRVIYSRPHFPQPLLLSRSKKAYCAITPTKEGCCNAESIYHLYTYCNSYIPLGELKSMLASQSHPISTLSAAIALPQLCSALSHGSSSLAAFLRAGIPCLCNKVGAPSVRRNATTTGRIERLSDDYMLFPASLGGAHNPSASADGPRQDRTDLAPPSLDSLSSS